MVSATLSPPAATEVDRLSLTVFFALVLHAILILGVSFQFEDRIALEFDSMAVVLVQSSSKEAPDKARYLAQANQSGGGESDNPERPSTPYRSPLPDITSKLISHVAAPEPVPATSGNNTPQRLATKRRALQQVAVDNQRPDPELTENQAALREQEDLARIREAMAMLEQNLAIASLDAEIKQSLKAYAERPRRKFISANTREYKYAAYMDAWRAKVERIGNLNYPDQARRQKLSGALVLDVALKPDGSIHKIEVRKASGHSVLDDAAIRIVRLAAPYAPFPRNIRAEVDILHITRTWQFLSSGTLRSR